MLRDFVVLATWCGRRRRFDSRQALDLIEQLVSAFFHFQRERVRPFGIGEALGANADVLSQLGHQLPAQVVANDAKSEADSSGEHHLADGLPDRDAVQTILKNFDLPLAHRVVDPQ
jgi:hypothetical protein